MGTIFRGCLIFALWFEIREIFILNKKLINYFLMLYHLITPIKVGDVFARALRIIYGINGVVPIPASHNYSGHTHIIIIITIIYDYCRKNFVLKKIIQIHEILNPRIFLPIRYVNIIIGNTLSHETVELFQR